MSSHLSGLLVLGDLGVSAALPLQGDADVGARCLHKLPAGNGREGEGINGGGRGFEYIGSVVTVTVSLLTVVT